MICPASFRRTDEQHGDDADGGQCDEDEGEDEASTGGLVGRVLIGSGAIVRVCIISGGIGVHGAFPANDAMSPVQGRAARTDAPILNDGGCAVASVLVNLVLKPRW